MTLKEQMIHNNECESALSTIEYWTKYSDVPKHWDRLYSCQAETCDWHDYILLKSYNTIVAAYDKTDGTLYDFLRAVYGYTATSTKHIAKFRNKLRAHNHEIKREYTYRAI